MPRGGEGEEKGDTQSTEPACSQRDVDDLSFFNTQGAGPGPQCWSKMLNNHGAARSPCTSLKTVVIADSFCNSVF